MLLIPVALALLAFGIYRLASADDSDTSGSNPPAAVAPPAEPPKPAPAPAPAPPQASEPRLTQTFSTGAFTMKAPQSWRRSPSDLGLKLVPRSSGASLEVFSDETSTSLEKLAQAVTPLVTTEAGVAPAPPRQATFQGNPALRLDASTDKGKTTGLVTIAGGTRYLILSDLETAAPPAVGAELDAIVASIRLR